MQRRDADEWRKLNHTHVGQWPSLEYQQGGRDRAWWDIANGKMPEQLGALFPYESTAWTQWKAAQPARDCWSGGWVVAGHVPGGRDFYGSARIERSADGDYAAHYELADVAGIALTGESKAIVYTGYEWRGSAEVGARSLREVYAVSEDGNRISGRWFDADHAEDGGEWTAIRESASPQVLAVLPRSIRAGSAGTVIVVGNGLGAATGRAAAVSFGEGTVVTNVERDAHSVRAWWRVWRRVRRRVLRTVVDGRGVGAAGGMYRQIDQVDAAAELWHCAVGGGRIAPVTAQFEAMASTRLPSGELLALGAGVRSGVVVDPFRRGRRSAPSDDKFGGALRWAWVFLAEFGGAESGA